MKINLHLSERELQVLELISLGHSSREIAQNLYLSIETIKTHRAKIMKKFNARNVAHIVRLALEMNVFVNENQEKEFLVPIHNTKMYFVA